MNWIDFRALYKGPPPKIYSINHIMGPDGTTENLPQITQDQPAFNFKIAQSYKMKPLQQIEKKSKLINKVKRMRSSSCIDAD